VGKAAEALPLFRKALAIMEKVLPEAHPDTARCYNNVAACLRLQGKHKEAAQYWEAALIGFECGRLFAGESGFDRARFKANSSLHARRWRPVWLD
jgi:hypothetical protein